MDTEVRDLGTMDYGSCLRFQQELLAGRINGTVRDTLILVEHYPVLTLGRLGTRDSIIDEGYFREKGIYFSESTRGGRITYHAPGQLVMYPVLDLRNKRKDISFYIDFLEKTVSRSLHKLGVPAVRDRSRRGVWTGGKKIAFIGVSAKQWVTYHGVSVNINIDIEPFRFIHPCGEADIEVTSAECVLGRPIDMDMVKKVFAGQFLADMGTEYGILDVSCRQVEV